MIEKVSIYFILKKYMNCIAKITCLNKNYIYKLIQWVLKPNFSGNPSKL